ncbi:hypothetical protein DEU56DRAFT_917940 [Suillus clintonianus]|uniref:uncharacterized protein n=1 Tax=Suillus clintonianus TaxID=1904413 RepID=UPI001B876D10|nr:uncharacterized protein DEU56DRAFT_917940 [Suillus clintonianus]KAG2122141.1 hypothetical protein DEU56DRAFT_917940 [Suillus clintonianus]
MPKAGGKKTRFVSVSFDPATQVMVQAGHGYRRQQYSRDVTVGGAFQSQFAPHSKNSSKFRFFITPQPEIMQPEAPPPSRQPCLSPPSLPPSPPPSLPPSPSPSPPPPPPPSPLPSPSPSLTPSPPQLSLQPQTPLPESFSPLVFSPQLESVRKVPDHEEELSSIVAQLSQGLELNVLIQLANLQWDSTHSEMWGRYVDILELEKS